MKQSLATFVKRRTLLKDLSQECKCHQNDQDQLYGVGKSFEDIHISYLTSLERTKTFIHGLSLIYKIKICGLSERY